MIAIVEAYKSGLLKSEFWVRNSVAGVIVGLVALPLAMAFAIASGVKPEQGLYTAIVAAIVVSLFGGSRGPTGAFIVILAEITATYGVDSGSHFPIFAPRCLKLLKMQSPRKSSKGYCRSID